MSEVLEQKTAQIPVSGTPLQGEAAVVGPEAAGSGAASDASVQNLTNAVKIYAIL